MFFFRSNASREMMLRSYLRSHNIPYNSEEAKKIRERMKEIILRNPRVKEEAEQILVGVAVVSIGTKKRRDIDDIMAWMCLPSGLATARFIFRDKNATNFEGAKKVFNQRLKMY